MPRMFWMKMCFSVIIKFLDKLPHSSAQVGHQITFFLTKFQTLMSTYFALGKNVRNVFFVFVCLQRRYLNVMKRNRSSKDTKWMICPKNNCRHFHAYHRHGIRQLQNNLTSAPHLFNKIVLEMYRRDPASVEVILHW